MDNCRIIDENGAVKKAAAFVRAHPQGVHPQRLWRYNPDNKNDLRQIRTIVRFCRRPVAALRFYPQGGRGRPPLRCRCWGVSGDYFAAFVLLLPAFSLVHTWSTGHGVGVAHHAAAPAHHLVREGIDLLAVDDDRAAGEARRAVIVEGRSCRDVHSTAGDDEIAVGVDAVGVPPGPW